jgi:hypothetical protein
VALFVWSSFAVDKIDTTGSVVFLSPAVVGKHVASEKFEAGQYVKTGTRGCTPQTLSLFFSISSREPIGPLDRFLFS